MFSGRVDLKFGLFSLSSREMTLCLFSAHHCSSSGQSNCFFGSVFAKTKLGTTSFSLGEHAATYAIYIKRIYFIFFTALLQQLRWQPCLPSQVYQKVPLLRTNQLSLMVWSGRRSESSFLRERLLCTTRKSGPPHSSLLHFLPLYRLHWCSTEGYNNDPDLFMLQLVLWSKVCFHMSEALDGGN